MLQVLAIYLLKVIVCSALLLSYYWIVLRNKRFHYYNRFYLLSSVALSIILPMLDLQLFILKSNSDNAIHLLNVIYASGENDVVVKAAPALDWQQFLMIGLFGVTAFLSLSLCARILKIYRFKKIYPVNKTEEFDFVNTDLSQAPFSFLKNIFWRNDISIEEATGQQILQHELTHIKQKHTWDKLFMQTVLCFFWMNPFYWLIRSELFFIHEFIADEKAVGNKDTSAFAAMLLHAQYGKSIFSPAQSFFYSPIKRRLLMLTTSKEPRFSYARRIMAMPLLAFIILLSAFRIQKTEPETKNISVVDTMPRHTKITQIQHEAKFPGGVEAWEKYLEKNLNTKILTDKNAPPGNYTVGVTFLVDNEGNVSEVKALNDPGYGAADEAVRVIANSGKWIPATQNGKAVTFWQKQSITFRIDEPKKNPNTKNSNTQSITFKSIDQSDVTIVGFVPKSYSPETGGVTITQNENISPYEVIRVEQQPQFPGGRASWNKYLERNVNSDIPIKNHALPGIYTVIVSFKIDENGNVSEVKALNDPGYKTADEAVRVIQASPKWIPAKNEGKNVIAVTRQKIIFQVAKES